MVFFHSLYLQAATRNETLSSPS